MGAQDLKSDDSEPFKREPRNRDPLRSNPVKEALRRPGPAPSGRLPAATADALEPPWQPAAKSKPRRGTFEGDEAAIELRSRLAAARNGRLAPRESLTPRFGAALRFTSLVLTAAVAAGAVGYLAGVKLPFKPAARPPVGASEASPAPMAARQPAVNRSLPTAPAIDVAGAGRAAGSRSLDDTAAGAARRSEVRPVSIAPSSPPLPPPDASEIAARLKLGADLMAAGDIAAARTMFARVAEAGDAEGAFALAETYDPAVLGTMRLRGGLTPDPVLARQWYEKARDMGSGTAPERIARLAGR